MIINNINNLLPYKAPFLFIDRVEEFEPNEKMVAVKNVTADERMLIKGREGDLYFPETLIMEAAAQATLLFSRLNMRQDKSCERFFLTKINGEFFEQVFVGDNLKLRVQQVRFLGKGGYADVEAEVLECVVAKVEIFFSLLKGD